MLLIRLHISHCIFAIDVGYVHRNHRKTPVIRRGILRKDVCNHFAPLSRESKFNPLVFALDELTDELRSGEDFTEVASDVFSILCDILKYVNWGLRQTAAYALGYVAQFVNADDKPVLIDLLVSLQADDKREVRDAAAESLGMALQDANVVASVEAALLTRLVEGEHWEHLEGALMAAGRFMARCRDRADAVSAAVCSLSTSSKYGFYSDYIRFQVFRALDRWVRAAHPDPTVGPLTPTVLAGMTDGAINVRRAAATVWAGVMGLKEYGATALTRTAEGLTTGSWEMRQSFSLAVEKTAPHTPGNAVETVTAALNKAIDLNTDDSDTCQASAAAIKALARLTVTAAPTPTSVRALADTVIASLKSHQPWLLDAGCIAVQYMTRHQAIPATPPASLEAMLVLVHRVRHHPSLPIRTAAHSSFISLASAMTGQPLTHCTVDTVWTASRAALFHTLMRDIETGTNDSYEATHAAYASIIAALDAQDISNPMTGLADDMFAAFTATTEGTASIRRARALDVLTALGADAWAELDDHYDEIVDAAMDFDDDELSAAALRLLGTIGGDDAILAAHQSDLAPILYSMQFGPSDKSRSAAFMSAAKIIGNPQLAWDTEHLSVDGTIAAWAARLSATVSLDIDVDPAMLRGFMVMGLLRYLSQLFPVTEPGPVLIPQEIPDVDELIITEDTATAIAHQLARVVCSADDEEAHTAAVAAAAIMVDRSPSGKAVGLRTSAPLAARAAALATEAEWDVDVDFDDDEPEADPIAVEEEDKEYTEDDAPATVIGKALLLALAATGDEVRSLMPLREFPLEHDAAATRVDAELFTEVHTEPMVDDDADMWALHQLRPLIALATVPRFVALYHLLAHAEGISDVSTVQMPEDLAERPTAEVVLEARALAAAIRLDPTELPLQSTRQHVHPMAATLLTRLPGADPDTRDAVLEALGDILPFSIHEPAEIVDMIAPVQQYLTRAHRRATRPTAALAARVFASVCWDRESWAVVGRFVATFIEDDDIPEEAKLPIMPALVTGLCEVMGTNGRLTLPMPAILDEDDARVNESFTQEGVDYAKAKE